MDEMIKKIKNDSNYEPSVEELEKLLEEIKIEGIKLNL